ncbi:MAG TPA: AmmeMemoRadiSam system protein B [Bacteroidetes bacterium]|nr:AmmeMemoRadiSam system protein B [Bacteroidota bacterium]
MKYTPWIIPVAWLLLCTEPPVSAQRDRQPAVAGSFYPAQEALLRASLEEYSRIAGKPVSEHPVRALIVPHAGYVYSGPVAAAAFSRLDPETEYRNVFLIGVSHTAMYHGAAVYASGHFITPLGKVPVNASLAADLVKNCREMHDHASPHMQEHSLEVELPFLQYRLKKDFQIVPILIGTRDPGNLRALARCLEPYFIPGNLFVISTDFSHYPSAGDAEKVDRSTAEAVASNDPEQFLQVVKKNEASGIKGLVTAMCGWPAVYCLLNLTQGDPGLEYSLVRYANSGQVPHGDKSRAVGYWAIELIEKEKEHNTGGNTFMNLTELDKKHLLEIARRTLERFLDDETLVAFNPDKLSPNLKQEGGAFVTLTKNGALRGCIGRFADTDPLYLTVQKMAVAAAIQDSRFKPVTREELDELEIEISVLSPLQPIQSKDEIVLGKHGIYMRKGFSTGTFLPQVGEKYGWTVEEFLGRCARDKAGIGYYGWKDAELFVFEATVFSEHELSGR